MQTELRIGDREFCWDCERWDDGTGHTSREGVKAINLRPVVNSRNDDDVSTVDVDMMSAKEFASHFGRSRDLDEEKARNVSLKARLAEVRGLRPASMSLEEAIRVQINGGSVEQREQAKTVLNRSI